MSYKTKKHLTFTDRLRIERGLRAGKTKTDIAAELRVSRATVYRELKRGRYLHLNSDYTTEDRYSPDIAEQRYRDMLKNKGRPLKIGKDHELANFLEEKIADENFSPEAALNHISEHSLNFSTKICTGTVYNYIRKGVFLRLTMKKLPRHGKSIRKRTQVKREARPPMGESIENRPAEVESRKIFGHWEMDTVVGCRGCRSVLLVLTERKTRFELLFRLKDKTAAAVVKALDNMEKQFDTLFAFVFQSITMDNGTEFSDTDGLQRSVFSIDGEPKKRTNLYYCHPYSAYERGSNENANTLIRRFFPKGTNFDNIPQKELSRVLDWINNYPRGVLGGRCALNVFRDELAALQNTAA